MGRHHNTDRMNTGAAKREKAESFSFENYKKVCTKQIKKPIKLPVPRRSRAAAGNGLRLGSVDIGEKNPTAAPDSGVFAFYRFSFFNASIRLSFFILFIEYSMLIKTTANTLPTAITIGTAGM